MFPADNSSTAPHESLVAVYSVRVAVGIASTLSMFGATIVILSYAAFPQLRTTARQLLLNLSVAHFVVVLTDIGGLIENAGRIIINNVWSGTNSLLNRPTCSRPRKKTSEY